MKFKFFLVRLTCAVTAVCSISGCMAAAVGVGAETAYIATQEDRTTSEVMNDQRITAAIKSKLLVDQNVPGMDVNVDTFKGVVTLRGVLRNDAQVNQALHLARETSGVKEVKSELHVG